MIKCIICGQEFEKRVSFCNHISRKHNMIAKEYYDKYLKKPEEGICKYEDCNNPTYFLNVEVGYKECCCLKHTNLYRYGVESNLNFEETKAKAQKNSHTKEAIEKQIVTNMKKYGTKFPMQSDEIKNKVKQTCIEKYGVENPYQAEEIKEKSAQTRLDRYGDANYNNREKAKKTCLEKYGVKHQMYLDSVKNKIKSTCKEKYGVDNVFKLNFSIQNAHTSEAQHKRNIANRNRILAGKYRNKVETLFMTLCHKYSITVIPEYDSDVYPYPCDFYVPDKDLYIEINNHWSHNTHWFDPNDKNDLDKVNYWKSKNTVYYDRAIDVWTVSDVAKRKIAKENNLNYVVLWSIDDIKNWFLDNCPIRHDWK